MTDRIKPLILILGAISAPAMVFAENLSSDKLCEYPVSIFEPNAIPEGQLHMSAEEAVVRNNRFFSLKGQVRIETQEQTILTDQASYNRETQEIKAKGNINLQREELNFTSDSFEVDLANNTAIAKNTEYHISATNGNGFAESIKFENSKLHLKNADYTTCPPKDKAWQISAREISLNQEKNEGIARGAKIEIFSVPLLYIPYISFPLQGRKSGFLPATPSYSSTDGFDLEVPYYFNLAPNYDMTFSPRYIQQRGPLIGTEFRYLQYDFAGEFGFEYLPDDDQENADRYQVHFLQRNYISPRTWLLTSLTHVSDRDYYSDLGTSLNVVSQTQIDRHITLQTRDKHWYLMAMVQDYEMLNEIDEPYRRVPQVDFYGRKSFNRFAGNAFSQYSYFFKNSDDKIHRLVLNPEISLPLEKAYGYLKPSTGIFGSIYQTQSDQLSHEQWYFHTSGALYLDRNTRFGKQSLIPHFSYLNMPYDSQSNLPLIDADIRPLSYEELFFPRRYTGWDRFGDIHRISWGISNHWIDSRGIPLGSFSIAHSYILDDQKLNFAGDTPLNKGDNIYASMLETKLIGNLHLSGEVLSINQTDGLESAAVSAHYAQSAMNQMELRHDFRSNVLEQTSLILISTINSQWRFATRWSYSTRYEQIREGLVGLEYNNCCWSLRIQVRRYANDIDEDAKNSISAQFELKGLTSIGSQLENTFSQEIFGIQ